MLRVPISESGRPTSDRITESAAHTRIKVGGDLHGLYNRVTHQHESIMVVVDTLTKATHFIPVQSTFGTAQIANIFMKNIFRLHGIPKTIVPDKDANLPPTLEGLVMGFGN